MNIIKKSAIGLTLVSSALAAVYGTDNRKEVKTVSFPWTALGRVDVSKSHCTAALVGPCQILTAAHCLISRDTQLPYSYPKTFRTFGSDTQSNIIHIYFGTPQSDTSMRENDWAIAVLDRPLGKQIGTFEVRYQRSTDQTVGPLIIAGYNSDLYGGNRLTVDSNAYWHRITDKNLIVLEADTFLGASGAPIWRFDDQGKPVIYGIHTRSVMDADPETRKTIQKHVPEFNENISAVGISTAQFWDTYQASLKYQCPE
jgi:V8-like Glu-specific endopeptidase